MPLEAIILLTKEIYHKWGMLKFKELKLVHFLA